MKGNADSPAVTWGLHMSEDKAGPNKINQKLWAGMHHLDATVH